MVLTTGCMNLLLEDGVIYEGMYKGVWRYCNNNGEYSIPPDAIDLEQMEADYTKYHIGTELREEVRHYREMVKARLPPRVLYACLKWLSHIRRSDPSIYDAPQTIAMLERKGQSWIDDFTCMGEAVRRIVIFGDYEDELKILLNRLVMSQHDGVKV